MNKTVLKQCRDHLAMYQRFLPSLDMKRQQLIANYRRAKAALAATEGKISELFAPQSGLFALLGASEQNLSGLVRVESVKINEENSLGIMLPMMGEIRFQKFDYSMLAKPFWVDLLVELLQEAASLKVRRHVETQRVNRLSEAVRRITQRVNLFEQVLIPQTEKDIQKIRIYLADAERSAVIRSKIAKAKRRRVESGKVCI